MFLLAEEPRIVYLLPGREIGKRFQADIDADLCLRWRQGISLQFPFHADAHKPFACGRPFHRGRLGDACERSMHHHLDVPEFGEDEAAFLFLASMDIKAVLVLLEGEAMVAQVRSEARMPWLLALLDALEKAVKGPIHPLEHVL